MTAAAAILTDARARIADRRAYCQFAGIQPRTRAPAALCAVMALSKAGDGKPGPIVLAAQSALAAALPAPPLLSQTGNHAVMAFNDARTTTHRDIIALFDRAIDIAGLWGPTRGDSP